MTARTAADVPELVEAGAREMCGGRTPTREALADTRLALSVVPAPLRPIDPDDADQWDAIASHGGTPNNGPWPAPSTSAILYALRDLGVGLPARAEPSDAAVEAFKRAWSQASEENDVGNRSRRGITAAYAVDGAK